MKTTIILKSALSLSLAAASLYAQPPARKSKWISIPAAGSPASAQPSRNPDGLIRALAAIRKARSSSQENVLERISLQRSLPGTWLIHVTPQGPEAPPPFISLGQFSADGNFIETESDALAEPASLPGQGVWTAASSGSFQLTFYAILIDGADFLGMLKVTGRAQLDDKGESFKGMFDLSFFDANGQSLGGGSGEFRGTRLDGEVQ